MPAHDAIVAGSCTAAAENRDRGVSAEPEHSRRGAATDGEPVGIFRSEVVPVTGIEPTHEFAVPQVVPPNRPRLVYLVSSFPYGRNDVFFGPEVRELRRQGVEVLVVPIRPRGKLTTRDAG